MTSSKSRFLGLVLVLLPALLIAQVTDIPWKDPKHKIFFKYQTYLLGQGLQAETERTWTAPKRTAQHRLQTVKWTEGILKQTLEETVAQPKLLRDPGRKNLIQTVWGDEVLRGIERVAAALLTRNPNQVRGASQRLQSSLKKLGDHLANRDIGEIVDGAVFHAGESNGIEMGVPRPSELQGPDKQEPFLQALESDEVKKLSSDLKFFKTFLELKKVPEKVADGLVALHEILSRANGEEIKELGHILPTIVYFLREEKKIELDDKTEHAGYAEPDEYDKPQKVGISTKYQEQDRHMVANVLIHEFQHVYDQYVGRHYTLDSELRGFKTEVLFFGVLKREFPELHEALGNHDKMEVRTAMREMSQYSEAYAQGPRAFSDNIDVGKGYTRWSSGYLVSRRSLRNTLDPTKDEPAGGPSRQLASLQSEANWYDRAAAELKTKQERLSGKLEAEGPNREVEMGLHKVTRDLEMVRYQFSGKEREAALLRMQIARMRHNLKWLDATKGPNEPYDLSLRVDAKYFKP